MGHFHPIRPRSQTFSALKPQNPTVVESAQWKGLNGVANGYGSNANLIGSADTVATRKPQLTSSADGYLSEPTAAIIWETDFAG